MLHPRVHDSATKYVLTLCQPVMCDRAGGNACFCSREAYACRHLWYVLAKPGSYHCTLMYPTPLLYR